MTFWLTLVLLSAAPDGGQEDMQQRAEAYVASIDSPVSAAEWRALGTEGAAALERMANDPSVLPSRRARALSGLAYSGGAEARSTLERFAQSAGEPLTVRLSALRGLGQVLGQADLIATARPLLERDADPRIRAGAAEVMAASAGQAGCGAVLAQREKESARTQPFFGRAAKRCAQTR